MYPSIQIFRGVAALLVVLFHVGDTLAKDKYFGAQAAWLKGAVAFGGPGGVAFFFVLSGFIIMHVHRGDLGRPHRLAHYAGRRVVRIYPMYLLVFGAVYAMALALPSLRATVTHDGFDLAAALLLIPQPPVVAGINGAHVVTVAWTLQYEVVFYAVFALGIVHRWWLFAAIAAFLAYQTMVDRASMGWLQAFFASDLMFLFMFGMLVAEGVRRKPQLPRARSLGMLCIGAFAAVGFVHAVSDPKAWWLGADLVYGLISALVLLCFVTHESSGPRTASPQSIGQRLGDASYSIYLVHLPVVSIGCKAAMALKAYGAIGLGLSFASIFAISAGAGWLAWQLVERPMQRRLKRWVEVASPRLGTAPVGASVPKA